MAGLFQQIQGGGVLPKYQACNEFSFLRQWSQVAGKLLEHGFTPICAGVDDLSWPACFHQMKENTKTLAGLRLKKDQLTSLHDQVDLFHNSENGL